MQTLRRKQARNPFSKQIGEECIRFPLGGHHALLSGMRLGMTLFYKKFKGQLYENTCVLYGMRLGVTVP